jgi:hypothetical protein
MNSSDWIGTIGVSILLIAFGLNLLNVVSAKSYLYLYFNFIGAALAGIASSMISYLPFIVLESVWTLVSLYAIIEKHRKGEIK